MISKTYEGNKSLKGLRKVTPALEAKIRRILNDPDSNWDKEQVRYFAGVEGGEGAYVKFSYRKHEIAVDADDGIITVFEYDYYGGYSWAYEAREIGKFQF